MKVEEHSIHYNINEVRDAARWLIEQSGGERVWLFDAPMGGGKTTLINALCALLDVAEVASSPTFAIVNEYHTSEGEPLYHIDAYRLETEQDGANIGIGEYLCSGAYCFVEWPGVLDRLLPEEAFRIRIEQEGEEERKITLLAPDEPYLFDVR